MIEFYGFEINVISLKYVYERDVKQVFLSAFLLI